MSSTSKDKWNRIYANRSEPGQAAAVLVENEALLSMVEHTNPTALDIACGNGANTLFLAEHGFIVDAWDISDVAIDNLKNREQPGVKPAVVDINPASLTNHQFDVIVNCHYLDRSLIASIREALAPGGVLFFQTFTQDRLLQSGPSNPDFLLAKGELREFVRDMEVLAHRDGSMIKAEDDPLAGREYIVARKVVRKVARK